MPENDDPIGGGGLPEPKRSRTYGKLPGLTLRQTYRVITALPIVQLGIIAILFFFIATDFYHISHKFLLQIVGFSLFTSLYSWYAAKFMGSCGGTLISIYALIILNIINMFHVVFVFNYYGLYGLITTGAGLILSLLYYRR